jgi:DNA-binding NarL/FixJ family response regulator
MAEPIRVLVVDDHAVVRQGLRGLLELQDGIEVAGDAADGDQGVEAATRLRPDVILMDLVMPALDGVAAMRLLRERLPETRVIVLTSFLDDDSCCLRSGRARPATCSRTPSRRRSSAPCVPLTPARR